jgi:hypothetical protein
VKQRSKQSQSAILMGTATAADHDVDVITVEAKPWSKLFE